jgi:hypothetical protein
MESVLAERGRWRKPAPEPERRMPNLHNGARASVEKPPSLGQVFRDALRGGLQHIKRGGPAEASPHPQLLSVLRTT